MNKKPTSDLPDKENTEWTDIMFREATTLENSDLPVAFKEL